MFIQILRNNIQVGYIALYHVPSQHVLDTLFRDLMRDAERNGTSFATRL